MITGEGEGRASGVDAAGVLMEVHRDRAVECREDSTGK